MSASEDSQLRLQPLFEIGRGGVAVVRAEKLLRDDGTTDLVAVKRLLPLVTGDPKIRDMFFEEARLAALLDHPNIVRIVGVGLDEDPFIALELVRGEPLSALIAAAKQREQPPLEPALAAWVLAEVCAALDYAHELTDANSGEPLRLVHRDISPQNILVGFDGRVLLTDFGIAKALGFGARTRTGEVKGKLPYMSPEQVLCDPLDRRSDLFSVGAVLFETVVGRRMWGEGSELEALRRISNEQVPSLQKEWPEAPASLCALHARLVARPPQERPATAREVAESLRTFAALEKDQAKELLKNRLRDLFPGKSSELERRLRLGEPASGTATGLATTTTQLKTPAHKSPILLFGSALAVGLVIVVAALNRSAESPHPGMRTTDLPFPSTAHSVLQEPESGQHSAPSGGEPSGPPLFPSASSTLVSPVVVRKSPLATVPRASSTLAPTPRSSAPVRTDKLDEKPF